MSRHPKKPRGRPKKRSMTNPGRPLKTNLSEVSYSTINRRAHDLAAKYDIRTLELALTRAKRNEHCIETPEIIHSPAVPHSPESAFALFLENDCSKLQWDRLVQDAIDHDAPIYPSFYMLSKVKEQCRPTVFSMETEICVQVPFQVMLNVTVERLVNAVGTDWPSEDLKNLVLLCAYGFDSSSGFINPHQKFSDKDNISLRSELSLFASTFIICGLLSTNNKRMWINPTPQSVRFCRPLRIALEKENDDAIITEKDRLETEANELCPHSFSLPNGKSVSVNFDLNLTMIDGKCLNVISENSATTCCPVCYVSMDKFNKDEDWKSIIPTSNLTHGIANLHCEIKAMEQLIKLSCRKPLKSWTVRKEVKEIKDREMAKIKNKLFEAFSVRVDEVKHGSGTSLNGNTARKCFKDPSTLAKVLGIKEDLVKRLSFILLAFKQKEGVNLQVLDKYCTETYKMFFKKYPWAKMNPSVHKMLRHGVPIAQKFPLSLAYFAEDAAESMHKCYKNNSIYHARQNSRENRLKDVFNRAVDMSDPLISMFYLEKRLKAHKDELPPEFRTLFGLTNSDN